MLRLLLVTLVCCGFISCEWEDVKHSDGFLAPNLKIAKSEDSTQLCFPDSSKWVKVRDRLDTKGPKSLRIGISDEWKSIYERIMVAMKKRNIKTVFTYTVEEKIDATNKYITFFFKLSDNENIVLDLSCSKDRSRNCAVIANEPPACFKGIRGKEERAKTNIIYSFPIEDNKVEKFKEIDFERCNC